MPQATTSPASGRDGVGERPADDLVAALSALITHLKRRSGDPDTNARAYLLGHVERLAPVRATDLADHVALDLSTISRHLRSLEDAGFLTRSPDPDDRRASLLSVTDEGLVFLDHARRGGRAVILAGQKEVLGLVEAFLARHPEFKIVPWPELWRSGLGTEPLDSADGSTDTLLMTPHSHGTDGFFVAVLERQGTA